MMYLFRTMYSTVNAMLTVKYPGRELVHRLPSTVRRSATSHHHHEQHFPLIFIIEYRTEVYMYTGNAPVSI